MSSVLSVSKSCDHVFSKEIVGQIVLIKGEGVAGDAHRGAKVKHRSRVKVSPAQPNLRQVHLIHFELIQELRGKGFNVHPGAMGENITTSQIDLLCLPTDTVLLVGADVQLRVTGLRNPCRQLDSYQQGLMAAVLDRDDSGNFIRKAGVMSVVVRGGAVTAGDRIRVVYPQGTCRPLECV